MWVSTFHSACVRILRVEIGRFNLSRTFSIYDDADSKRLMQLVAHDLELDPKRFPVRAIMNWVSTCKNELVDHEAAAARAETADRGVATRQAYAEYQRRLIAANALDFDDLIMTTVHLLQAFPDLREQYRRRFRHVLVDEYQDTNHAQYVLIRELCSAEVEPTRRASWPTEPPELMVVGDSDQSIYAFRGATIRNINDFESDFPGARVIMLEQNYRSTQTILNAANAVIVQNAGRKPKNLWSDAGDGAADHRVRRRHRARRGPVRRRRDRPAARGGAGLGTATRRCSTGPTPSPGPSRRCSSGSACRTRWSAGCGSTSGARSATRSPTCGRSPTGPTTCRCAGSSTCRSGASATGPRRRWPSWATRERISFGDALRRVDEIPGLATRSANQLLTASPASSTSTRRWSPTGVPADAILTSVLEKSGYLSRAARTPTDPQDETRLENLQRADRGGPGVRGQARVAGARPRRGLAELTSTSSECWSTGDARTGELATAEADRCDDPEADLAAGAPEPDPSLGAFLERVALVADSDQIPTPDAADAGVVTLMTLHTAKGLEFDTVFLTGLEDGVFPHQRALADRRQGAGGGAPAGLRRHHPGPPAALPDSRRGAVGLGRAAAQPAQPVPGRDARPPDRLAAAGAATTSWRNTSATSRANQPGANTVGYGARRPEPGRAPGARSLAPGDRVLHTTFGLGKVVATSGDGDEPWPTSTSAPPGVKRLSAAARPAREALDAHRREARTGSTWLRA